jgi:hypothetical protein
MRFLGAADILQRGFRVCEGLPSRNFDWQEPTKHDVKLFKKHHGSDPAVLARIWHHFIVPALLLVALLLG